MSIGFVRLNAMVGQFRRRCLQAPLALHRAYVAGKATCCCVSAMAVNFGARQTMSQS